MSRHARVCSPHALRLHEELTALSCAVEPYDRFLRAEAIERELEWLAGYLAHCSSSFRSEHAEQVKAHLRAKAEEGSLAYRGLHGPASAMSFLRRAARNKLLDILKKEQNERRYATRRAAQAALEAREEAEREEAWRAIHAARGLVVARLLRAGHAETARRIDLGIDHLRGERTEEQLARGEYLAPGAEGVALARAKQRLFQHRTRGRRAFSKLLGRLVLERQVDAADARLVCRHARLPLPRCLAAR